MFFKQPDFWLPILDSEREKIEIKTYKKIFEKPPYCFPTVAAPIPFPLTVYRGFQTLKIERSYDPEM